jgi:3-deoxy-D-manno-octulosonate 8-phosphate phosphatase (KDO 8-P phosphatase)
LNVLSLFNNIRLIALDVDGVLTNGNLLLTESGEWLRQMNIKDGYALQLAVKKGYHVAIISGSYDLGVENRLKKLGIKILHFNTSDKKSCLYNLVAELGLSNEQVLFMGDDMPDLQVMQTVGLACCPADAAEEVRAISHYISKHDGGSGCVRDVIRKVLSLNGDWDATTGLTAK